ncbi:SDR family NAD(P)-dependent oxidoreductase [Aciditerrimonas ferrireducens]|uniref:SDR family NAD(P)-dependent oxidoreductase n=1 Tax=Aciditerrimonas ferrireducens TaxID=667306 RepID=A0ABV6C1P2_9ACTN
MRVDDLRSIRLTGTTVVVTGATSGLGLAMADALLEAGATVWFAARPTPRLEATVAERAAAGKLARALAMDVRDPGAVERAAELAWDRGPVHLVVNNAGLGMRVVNPRFFEAPMPFFAVTPEAFGDVVATNLTGYFLVGRAFARRFVEAGGGRLVNVTMNHETMVRRGFVPYGPARAGAEALSCIMTEDLRPFGVTVNQLLPGGATATGMIPDGLPPEARARLLDPAIMGPPILFLASPAAEGLTGLRIVAKDFEAFLAEREPAGS